MRCVNAVVIVVVIVIVIVIVIAIHGSRVRGPVFWTCAIPKRVAQMLVIIKLSDNRFVT